MKAKLAAATLTCFLGAQFAPAWAQEPLYQPPDAPPPPGAVPPPPEAYPPPPMYQPPQAPPPPPPVYVQPPRRIVGYELRPRYGMIAGGASMLGAVWAITAISALASQAACSDTIFESGSLCRSTYWPLYVPVAGPFIQTAYEPHPALRALLVFDGLVQGTGLALIIAGAVSRKRVPVYGDRLQITPMATLGGSGVMASGRF